jgi:hypothetical protein
MLHVGGSTTAAMQSVFDDSAAGKETDMRARSMLCSTHGDAHTAMRTRGRRTMYDMLVAEATFQVLRSSLKLEHAGLQSSSPAVS